MLSIPQQQLDYIKDTLSHFLPEHVSTFAFGSRTKGDVRQTSDLDLLLVSDTRIAPQILAQLSEEFTDSDLVFPIDLIEDMSISTEFHNHIQAGLVLLIAAHS